MPNSMGDEPVSLRNYRLIHEIYVLLDASDQQILGRYDLGGSQYRLMMSLLASPGQRLTTLSKHLLLSKSTVSRIVDQLEERGWIRRVGDSQDRRAQSIALTPIGMEHCKAISRMHLQSLSDRFNNIGPQELTRLGELLTKVSAGLSAVLQNNEK